MNFYNEHDPKAAAWLRELIATGIIPHGIVDTRSILDLRPADLDGFTQCHFFAGIGGWLFALQLAGWPADRPVWTGSCPCQPFSAAGQGKGTADERHLWPAFFALIQACRPPVIFGEQVASAAVIGSTAKSPKRGTRTEIEQVWLDGICADLEAAHYSAGAGDIPAAGIGAPHIRQRLYWVADAGRDRCDDQRGNTGISPEEGAFERDKPIDRGNHGGMADSRSVRCDAGDTGDGRSEESEGSAHGEIAGRCGGMADAPSLPGSEHEREPWIGTRGQQTAPDSAERGGPGRMADPISGGERGRDERRPGAGREQVAQQENRPDTANEPGDGCEDALRMGNPSGRGCRICGHETQQGSCGHPECPSGTGLGGMAYPPLPESPRLGALREQLHRPTNWDRFDLIPCRDGKTRRIESGTFPLAYGVSGRVGLLRGYGNAIVPQAAAEFVLAYLEPL